MSETSFGKYRLIAELGHGGMADVFLAVQAGPAGSGFSKLTVIKRLRPNLAEEPEFVSMLVDEARIAARLNHPNVVQTNEVGEVDNRYFIAMEYLDGQPFHRIQHRALGRTKDGSASLLTKELQCLVLMDALAGLHHAHELRDYDGTELRIVHRDITPHNIFVTYEGQVKVVDFGIAKAAGRASETRQGVVKGKVRYMAPEQAVGHDVDRRADVFAAGVVLWEALSGRRMWKDKDDLAIVQALVSGEVPASPREIDPTVPERLDAICRKALRTRPDERYATAEEFRQDLEEHLAESGHLVEGRRKLPGVVAELFKDKRAEIRGVIEKQLSVINARPSAEMRAVAVGLESNPSSTGPLSVSLEERSLSGSVSASGLSNQKTELFRGSVAPPPRRRSAVVVAVAAIVLAGGYFVWRGATGTRVDASASTTKAVVDTEVSLKVTSPVPSASARIDDGPLRALPLDIKVKRDDKEHALVLEAEGYVSKTTPVSFKESATLHVALEEKPAAAAAKTKDPKEKKEPVVARVSPQTWAPPSKATAAPTAKTEPAATTATPPAEHAPTAPSSSNRAGAGRLKIDDKVPW